MGGTQQQFERRLFVAAAMLRADSGTAYRGAYGKGQDGGTEVERRNSASGGAAQHLDTGLPPASPAQAPSMQSMPKPRYIFPELSHSHDSGVCCCLGQRFASCAD